MKRKFILASVVSVTLMGTAPAIFGADRDNGRLAIRNENRVEYSQVPGEVKRASSRSLIPATR